MVPPFALALAVGSYLFILSIYATLSYLHLHHHVQGAPATATWIDRGDDLTNASSLSTDHSKPVAPTVLHFALTSTSTLLLTMKRRQWDPGIRLAFSPMMASLYDDSSVGSCDRSPIDLTPWLSCQVNEESKRHASIESIRCDPSVDGAAPTVDRDPFLLRPIRPMVSMFKYCHPVLSRPTVPNIISNII